MIVFVYDDIQKEDWLVYAGLLAMHINFNVSKGNFFLSICTCRWKMFLSGKTNQHYLIHDTILVFEGCGDLQDHWCKADTTVDNTASINLPRLLIEN